MSRRCVRVAGFGGAGFQIGPGVGATLARWVSTGHTAIMLDKFSIARVGERTNAAKEEAGVQ